MLDVRMLTVGPVQENCFFVRLADADTAVVVDPGMRSTGCSQQRPHSGSRRSPRS